MEDICYCRKGHLIDEKIDEVTGDFVRRYSCGHSIRQITCKETLPISDEISKIRMESKNRIGKKPVKELEENVSHNDWDNPTQKIWKNMYKFRTANSTNVLQIVIYDKDVASGKPKHIHCKNCDNQWSVESKEIMDQLFDVNLKGKTKVICKKCGSNFEN